MALQKSTLTEAEIIKCVCQKRQFQAAYQQATASSGGLASIADLSSKDKKDARRDQVKLAMKIWAAGNKFIKAQCNKGRIVDTLYFGTFTRADTLDSSAGADFYVYCPGPKAIFKLGENRENVADMEQSILDEKLISMNVASVAQVCNCSPENVSQILSAIRDEVIECIYQRKTNVNMNFGVGTLGLTHIGGCQFKSVAPEGGKLDLAKEDQRDEADRVRECTEFGEDKSRHRSGKLTEGKVANVSNAGDKNDMRVGSASRVSERTKQSIAERSIQYMQQRQQHDAQVLKSGQNPSAAAASDYKFIKPQAPSAVKPNDSPYFEKRNKRISQSKGVDGAGERGQSYDALNGFLRNQIEASSRGASGKGGRGDDSSQGKMNRMQANAIIDQAAQMKARGDPDKVLDYVRSASAHTGVPTSKKNVGLSRMKITATQRELDKNAQADYIQAQANAAPGAVGFIHQNRELHTNSVHKSPFTTNYSSAGGLPAPFGIPTINNCLTPEKRASSIKGTIKAAGNEDAVSRTSERDVRKLVSKALNRKTISQAYHTNVPVFLRSEGPFSIYDHSLRYLKQQPEKTHNQTVTDQTTMQALKRHEAELQALKDKRESEKNNFYNNIANEQRIMYEAMQNHKQNMRANQSFIAMQMDQTRAQRTCQRDVDRQYYKPHFGPEETEDIVAKMNADNQFKKQFMNQTLNEQFTKEKHDSSVAKTTEMAQDKEYLRVAIDQQRAEDMTLRQKEMMARHNLKSVWEEQMRHRKQFDQNDRLFQ